MNKGPLQDNVSRKDDFFLEVTVVHVVQLYMHLEKKYLDPYLSPLIFLKAGPTLVEFGFPGC
jgi:hypothetical protein